LYELRRRESRRFRFCGACGAQLDERNESFRKTVTVLFSERDRSTALGERLDPGSCVVSMSTYFREIRAIIERHGGWWKKFIGDAVMADVRYPSGS
jgi:class 3 adenylate cyclase